MYRLIQMILEVWSQSGFTQARTFREAIHHSTQESNKEYVISFNVSRASLCVKVPNAQPCRQTRRCRLAIDWVLFFTRHVVDRDRTRLQGIMSMWTASADSLSDRFRAGVNATSAPPTDRTGLSGLESGRIRAEIRFDMCHYNIMKRRLYSRTTYPIRKLFIYLTYIFQIESVRSASEPYSICNNLPIPLYSNVIPIYNFRSWREISWSQFQAKVCKHSRERCKSNIITL